MANSTPSSEELNSWKEIAWHLGLSVRAAQKRQKEGLPVRRMPGKKPRVWALRSELDAWKLRITTGEPHRKVEVALPEQAFDQSPGAPVTGNLRDPSFWPFRRRWVAAGVAIFAVMTVAVLWIVLRFNASQGPARAEVTGRTLVAFDEMDHPLWRHTFPQQLMDRGTRRADGHPGRAIQVADLYGRGSRQVLFAATFAKSDGTPTPDFEELYCFSSKGQILWRYKPNIAVTMGDARFTGPWSIMDVLVTPGGRGGKIWLALAHVTWYPGVLLSMSPEGVPSIKFVNAGHIYAVNTMSGTTGHYILAGGINNEYNAAYLAIVRDDAAPSCSPQTPGTRFECIDIPTVNLERYFVFPQTDVSVADGRAYNAVQIIEAVERQYRVSILEAGHGEPGTAIYELSPFREIQNVSFDDSWAVSHRRLERAGVLNHTLATCPVLRAPLRIRRWEKMSGWTSVEVPIRRGVGLNAMINAVVGESDTNQAR